MIADPPRPKSAFCHLGNAYGGHAMAKFCNPSGIWSPFGAFSMAAIPDDGQIVCIKGQIPLDEAGNVIGQADMRQQVRQVLDNLRTVLGAFNGNPGDLIELNQYTTDIDAFMACSDIREQFFEPPCPVTTTVEVRRLFRSDILIEISAVAQIPLDRFRPLEE